MSKPGRNAVCPCGSGKKYKHCCQESDEQLALAERERLHSAQAALPSIIAEGVRLHQAGQFEEAQALYRKVLHLNPRDPDALHLLGVIARDCGDPERAVVLISQAIEVLPGEANFHNNLGMAYRQQGLNDQAEIAYQMAISIKPDHAEALNNLGNICSDKQHFQKAIECFERAIDAQPAFAEAYFNLGHVLQSQECYERALVAYAQALELRPDYVNALSNKGMLLHVLGRDEEALACLELAIGYQADFHPAYMNIGSISLNNGLAREALPFLQHAHQLSPLHANTLNILSHAEKNLGLIDGAIAHAQAALRLAPKSKPGVESAIRLALLSYLDDDLAVAGSYLAFAGEAMNEMSIAVRAYWHYLKLLLEWRAQHDPLELAQMPALYAVGDSHVLSLQAQRLNYRTRLYRGKALWVEGCKQWHLGNDEDNAYKMQFSLFLAGIPAGSPVLISVGEIDCRPNEGLLKAWSGKSEESLVDLMRKTISDFVVYVAELRDRYSLDVSLAGVPASNACLDGYESVETQRFLTLLRDFNGYLAQEARHHGMGFLDLFAVTNAGRACADGRWHIDSIHLKPTCYAEAFIRAFVNSGSP